MKREFLFIAALLWTGSAVAADTGHCDSKPFTLKKPTAAAPAKPVPPPAPVAAPAPPKPKPTTTAKTAQAGKGKYAIGCKQPKS